MHHSTANGLTRRRARALTRVVTTRIQIHDLVLGHARSIVSARAAIAFRIEGAPPTRVPSNVADRRGPCAVATVDASHARTAPHIARIRAGKSGAVTIDRAPLTLIGRHVAHRYRRLTAVDGARLCDTLVGHTTEAIGAEPHATGGSGSGAISLGEAAEGRVGLTTGQPPTHHDHHYAVLQHHAPPTNVMMHHLAPYRPSGFSVARIRTSPDHPTCLAC